VFLAGCWIFLEELVFGGLEISPVDEGQCQAFVNTVMNV
jgi:hypothetical protein